jgi:hypothetical protein
VRESGRAYRSGGAAEHAPSSHSRNRKTKTKTTTFVELTHASQAMAEIEELLGGLLSAIVLVFQVALGTVLAALQYAFGCVKW